MLAEEDATRPTFDPHARRARRHGVQPVVTGAEKPLLLVVEDSPILWERYQEWLADRYTLSHVTNGLGALEEIVRLRPALIILDWMLEAPAHAPAAQLSGLDVLRTLKRSVLRHTPVVMLTAKSGMLDRLGGRVWKANAYLTKPVDVRALRQVVARLLLTHDPDGDPDQRHP